MATISVRVSNVFQGDPELLAALEGVPFPYEVLLPAMKAQGVSWNGVPKILLEYADLSAWGAAVAAAGGSNRIERVLGNRTARDLVEDQIDERVGRLGGHILFSDRIPGFHSGQARPGVAGLAWSNGKIQVDNKYHGQQGASVCRSEGAHQIDFFYLTPKGGMHEPLMALLNVPPGVQWFNSDYWGEPGESWMAGWQIAYGGITMDGPTSFKYPFKIAMGPAIRKIIGIERIDVTPPPPAVALASVDVTPARIGPGQLAIAHVKLTGPAPTEIWVPMSGTDNSIIAVPGSTPILAGADSNDTPFQAIRIPGQDTPITITFSLGGVSKSVTVTVAGGGPPPPNAPVITAISPAQAAVFAEVSLGGQQFGTVPGTVVIAGTGALVKMWADTAIRFTVPPGVGAGALDVQVRNGNGKSNVVKLMVTADPNPPPSGLDLALRMTTLIRTRARVDITVTGGKAPLAVTGDVSGRLLPNLSPGRVSQREMNATAGEVVTITVKDAAGVVVTKRATVQ